MDGAGVQGPHGMGQARCGAARCDTRLQMCGGGGGHFSGAVLF